MGQRSSRGGILERNNKAYIKVKRYPENMDNYKQGYIFLLCSHLSKLSTQLQDDGVELENIFAYPLMSENDINLYNEFYFRTKRKKAIKKYIKKAEQVLNGTLTGMDFENGECLSVLTVVLNTSCTLKCENCFAEAPYIKPRFFEQSDIISDFENFIECVKYVIQVEIIGGEPFLHPDLAKILQAILKEEKFAFIQISTNGTVPPRQDVLQIIKNPRILICVSVYDSYTLDIWKQLKEVGIKISFKRFLWSEMPKHDKSHLLCSYDYSNEELLYVYANCETVLGCATIMNHRFYSCYRTAMLDYQGNYFIEKWESADLTEKDINIRGQRIRDVIGNVRSKACNYCGISDLRIKEVLPGQQIIVD